MAERKSRLATWLRERLGGAPDAEPAHPGVEAELTLAEALDAFERRVCGTVARYPGESVSAKSAFAAAAGASLAGGRAAAFLDGDALAEVVEPLRTSVERRLPFVVHASFELGHDGYHDVASSGAFQAFASDAQEALDLSIACRRVAELSLTPGTLGRDAELGGSTGALREADASAIDTLLGAASASFECPTPAQKMLFGERRRAVPRWFDPDRPSALGVPLRGSEHAAAAIGRAAFFAEHLPEIVDLVLADVALATGRKLSTLRLHRVDKATHLIVSQGTAVRAVESIVDELSSERRDRVGSVGVIWFRPEPNAALAEALEGVERVLVLDRVSRGTSAPPLHEMVTRALRGREIEIVSATYDRFDRDAVRRLAVETLESDVPRRMVRIGVAPPVAARSAFPKREVLLERVARAYPSLADRSEPGSALAGENVSAGEHAVPDEDLPGVVRRFGVATPRYDSVPRFWSEFAEPRAHGEGDPPVADPYLALGSVPPCTAAMHDRAPYRERVPRIDAATCTGCGKCWTFCPDSAIFVAAIGTEALLDHAAARVELEEGDREAARKLGRAHKQWASRIDRGLASRGDGTVEASEVEEAFDWLAEKMGVEDDVRASMKRVASAYADQVASLAPAVTDPFFVEPHTAERGTGEALVLAIDPRGCQGCGICAAECPVDAIATEPQTPARADELRAAWSRFEDLPDTSGATIARVAARDRFSPLAAILASRHCASAVVGASGAEPGSGARLAVRQIAGTAEFVAQRRAARFASELDALERDLREGIRSMMSDAAEIADVSRLEGALEGAERRREPLGDVLSRLEASGQRTDVDVTRLTLLARSIREVERLRWETTRGEHGIGRSRFGLVLAGREVADWAERFPWNPFAAPVVVDRIDDAPELALGIARGLLERRLEDARVVRVARAVAEGAADLKARIESATALRPDDLDDEERELATPVWVVCSAAALGAADRDGVSRLLDSRLPVSLVVLDDLDPSRSAITAEAIALAHRKAAVASVSVARPCRTFRAVELALDHLGPSLLHVHAPSPSASGFATDETIAFARAAVEHHVHPIVAYDPRTEGAFGTRLSLSGNPGESSTAADVEVWLKRDARYAERPDDARAVAAGVIERWVALRELAGFETPFTDRVRETIEREVRDAHRAEVDALRRDHERALEELREGITAEQVERLKRRLMQLSGVGAAAVAARDDTPPGEDA